MAGGSDNSVRIGLYADRLTRTTTTGVGMYMAGLSSALAKQPRANDFMLFSVSERLAIPPGTYGAMPIGYLPWPRPAVHVAWSLLGRPRVNQLGGKLDLLHVLVPGVPVPTDLPLVATVHDLTPIKFPRFFDPPTRWLVGRALRQIGRQARRIIAASERTRRDVCEILNVPQERVAVVHQGVPADVIQPSGSELGQALQRYSLTDVPYVLFVGEITHRKNLLGLLDAFSLVAGQQPTVRLVLVGSPGLGAELVRRRIRTLGLERRAIMLGHVQRKDVSALMAGAAVFVLPSIYEGFGIPVLEAMTCGAPVVVSDGGSLPEVVGDAGLVVPGADPPALAAAIRRVIEDEALREHLRGLGLVRVRAFSWKRAAAQTLAVYEDALRG